MVTMVGQIVGDDGTRGHMIISTYKEGPTRGKIPFCTPPPQLKEEQLGGSEKHLGSLICVPTSEPQIYARCLSHILDPPPSIKGRMDEGFQNPMLIIDLRA
jgi:hypothetical protein